MTVAWAGSKGTAAEAEDVRALVTVARVDDWVSRAQPGACLLYGMGVAVAEAAGPGVAERLRALAGAGLVFLVQKRVTRADGSIRCPFDYLARRSGVAVPPKWPDLPPVAAAPKKVLTTKVAGRKS